MFISFINKNNTSSTLSNSVVLTKPTDTEAGDEIFVFIAINGTQGQFSPPPMFWSQRSSSEVGGRNHALGVYSKFALSGEPASYTFSLQVNCRYAAIIATFRNTRGSFAGTASSSISQSTSAIAPGTIIDDNGAALVVTSNAYGTTWTSPTDYTEIDDVRSGTASNDVSISLHYKDYYVGGEPIADQTSTSVDSDYHKTLMIGLIPNQRLISMFIV